MNDQNAISYGRNLDGTPGDILDRLQQVLDTTPLYSHVTRPLSRTLVRTAAAEISRLRAENAQLMAQLNNGDQPL